MPHFILFPFLILSFLSYITLSMSRKQRKWKLLISYLSLILTVLRQLHQHIFPREKRFFGGGRKEGRGGVTQLSLISQVWCKEAMTSKKANNNTQESFFHSSSSLFLFSFALLCELFCSFPQIGLLITSQLSRGGLKVRKGSYFWGNYSWLWASLEGKGKRDQFEQTNL